MSLEIQYRLRITRRRTSTNQWRYYAKDHLGSTRAVVTSTGSIVEVRDYYPYGLHMPGRSMVSGAPAKEGFTGHELDNESGLIYAGARYYIPNIGRWMGVDPLADKYPGWSPYNYVLNNPLGFVDPDGMAPCDSPQACNFSGWNSLRPFADALEYGYNQVADVARMVGDGIREGAAHLPRLSGLEGAIAAPGDFRAGGAVVAEGIAELREGNVQEGLDAIATGMQMRADAAGDVAGFAEKQGA